MDALLRRRMMIASGGSTPPTNYVQDGLVLHLDGINKGGTSGRWTSLVGNEYYTLTSNSTVESNAIHMNGSGAIESTNTTSIDGTSGTIEVCAEFISSPSSYYVVMYGPSGKLAFIVGKPNSDTPGATFFTGTSNNNWSISMGSIYTCSVNSSRCVYNGVSVSTKNSTSWSSNLSVNKIGGRPPYANAYYANIRIYSIRKYNRLLTEAEMLQNQAVDNIRFNLGLNPIPVFYDRLVFDGTAYIDTDIVPPSDFSCRCTFGNETLKSAQRIFGIPCSNSSGVEVNINSSTNTSSRYLNIYYQSSSPLIRDKRVDFTFDEYTVMLTPQRFCLGDTSYTYTKGSASITGSLVIGLIGDHSGVVYTGNMGTFRIYGSDAQNATSGSDLYNNYTPIYTLCPCTYNGVAGLWCVETSKFYENSASSGTLTVRNI